MMSCGSCWKDRDHLETSLPNHNGFNVGDNGSGQENLRKRLMGLIIVCKQMLHSRISLKM